MLPRKTLLNFCVGFVGLFCVFFFLQWMLWPSKQTITTNSWSKLKRCLSSMLQQCELPASFRRMIFQSQRGVSRELIRLRSGNVREITILLTLPEFFKELHGSYKLFDKYLLVHLNGVRIWSGRIAWNRSHAGTSPQRKPAIHHEPVLSALPIQGRRAWFCWQAKHSTNLRWAEPFNALKVMYNFMWLCEF